jgi:hypothetical protein
MFSIYKIGLEKGVTGVTTSQKAYNVKGFCVTPTGLQGCYKVIQTFNRGVKMDKYIIYEQEKRKLQQKDLSPKEYEKAIAELCQKLKI